MIEPQFLTHICAKSGIFENQRETRPPPPLANPFKLTARSLKSGGGLATTVGPRGDCSTTGLGPLTRRPKSEPALELHMASRFKHVRSKKKIRLTQGGSEDGTSGRRGGTLRRGGASPSSLGSLSGDRASDYTYRNEASSWVCTSTVSYRGEIKTARVKL